MLEQIQTQIKTNQLTFWQKGYEVVKIGLFAIGFFSVIVVMAALLIGG